MPAAGCPSTKIDKQSITNQQWSQHDTNIGPRHRSQNSDNFGMMTTSQAMAAGVATGGIHGSPKVVNPAPARPYKPQSNNIFGGSPNERDSQFSTTYTQFSQRQKFRGSKDGESDGLRFGGDENHASLTQLRRANSNLYPNVPYGMEAGRPSGAAAGRAGSHGTSNIFQEGGGQYSAADQSQVLSQQYSNLQMLMRERDRIYRQLSQAAMPVMQRQSLDMQMRDMENKIVAVEQKIFMLEQSQHSKF